MSCPGEEVIESRVASGAVAAPEKGENVACLGDGRWPWRWRGGTEGQDMEVEWVQG